MARGDAGPPQILVSGSGERRRPFAPFVALSVVFPRDFRWRDRVLAAEPLRPVSRPPNHPVRFLPPVTAVPPPPPPSSPAPATPPPPPPNAPAAPAKASSGTKVLIIVLCILGGLFLLVGGCAIACT